MITIACELTATILPVTIYNVLAWKNCDYDIFNQGCIIPVIVYVPPTIPCSQWKTWHPSQNYKLFKLRKHYSSPFTVFRSAPLSVCLGICSLLDNCLTCHRESQSFCAVFCGKENLKNFHILQFDWISSYKDNWKIHFIWYLDDEVLN